MSTATERIRVPSSRKRGQWARKLEELATSGELETGDWIELQVQSRTSAYQSAARLAAAQSIPPGVEFGAKENSDGTSTLLVRKVA